MINKHKLMKLVEDKSGTYINIDEILSCFRYKDQYKVKISDLIKSEGPEEHDNEIAGTANDEQWISLMCVRNNERKVLLKGTVEDLLDEYKGTIKDFSDAIVVIVNQLTRRKDNE
tara:strand:- start:5268 stop:5612 length:345 start_codon:yes stop_codon:yes gene_type:complete